MESVPWYQTFKGERINGYHLSLAEKRSAREKSLKNEIKVEAGGIT